MTREEELNKVNESLAYTVCARDRILPLSYEDKGMSKAQGILLEARDALTSWGDELECEYGSITASSRKEKDYVLRRFYKVKDFLNDQLKKYDGDFAEAEDAASDLDEAISALLQV